MNLNEIIPEYNSEQFLKSYIQDTMIKDAVDFLSRTHCLLMIEDQNRIQWFSKIYVDILMAIECDLKALIIGLSTELEKPEMTYKIVRSFNHSKRLLYEEVVKRANNEFTLLNEQNKNLLFSFISRMKIENRYELETFHLLLEDQVNKNFTEESIRSLLSLDNIRKFFALAQDIHKLAINSRVRLPEITMQGNTTDFHTRKKLFHKNIKDKAFMRGL